MAAKVQKIEATTETATESTVTAAERLRALAAQEMTERREAFARALNALSVEHGFELDPNITITSRGSVRAMIDFIPTR